MSKVIQFPIRRTRSVTIELHEPCEIIEIGDYICPVERQMDDLAIQAIFDQCEENYVN